jgi:hypothetical protein
LKGVPPHNPDARLPEGQTSGRSRTQKRLGEELEQLMKASGLGRGLTVTWMPLADKPLSGEVKGCTIFIYELDEGEALKTLRHEFLDFLVSQAIEPYRRVTNALIKMVDEDAYQAKEKAVDALVQLTGRSG